MSQYFGLDFGSAQLKAVQSDAQNAKSFTVSHVGSVPNLAGSLDFGDAQVTGKLAGAVKQLLAEAKIREKRVVVSAPESQVFSRIVPMPVMSEAELSSAITWEAEQFVPIPIADVELDYSIVSQPPKGSTDKKMLVYLVAAPKTYLQAMVDFLLSIGLDPIAVESEMVAVSRSISFSPLPGASLIVHMGALSTDLAIIENGALTFSYVSNVGGVALTRALAQALSLPLPQAEEYKRTYGLDEQQLEGKVRGGLLLTLSTVMSEIQKAVEYYATTNKTRIARIILSGGGAYLPALSTHLSGALPGMEVVVANPFGAAKFDKGVVAPRDSALYTVATGLSIRVF